MVFPLQVAYNFALFFGLCLIMIFFRWFQQLLGNKWLLVLLLLGLVFFLGLSLCKIWVTHKKSPDIQTTLRPTVVSTPVRVTALQQAAQAQLFGNSAQITQLPMTNLPLRLLGTYVHSDFPQHSLAIIETDNQLAEPYALEATLPNGARVKKIFADHIILNFQGKEERLELPRVLLTNLNQPLSDLSSANPITRPPVFEAPKFSEQSQDSEIISLQTALRFIPTTHDGKLALKVRPGTNRTLFNATGLQQDDLIIAINNKPLTNLEELQTYIQSSNQSAIRLTIQRQQDTQILDINFAQLR